MTTEKRVLVSPQDIIGMGFECPHCRAVYSVPVARLDRIATICPNCQQRWVSETQPSSSQHSEATSLRHFVDFLKELQQRDFGRSIRFEIKPDDKKEAVA